MHASILFTLCGLAFLLTDVNGLLKRKRLISAWKEVEKSNGDQWFEQRLNQFDNLDQRTFSQRYFVNDTFFDSRKTDSPVFLCVGGEGPSLTINSVIRSVHCNDAVELLPTVGGLMVALEHRYYGKSSPFKNPKTENLQYLSSQQALADLSTFHTEISVRYNLTSTNKWVTFGGSYPGMLSGWARLKYPHLFYASVASSAPMLAEFDFQGYYNVVGNDLREPRVGGSEACLSIVETGHEEVGELLKTYEGQAVLIKKFHLKGGPDALQDKDTQIKFASFGVFPFNWQGNDPACSGYLCNIKKLCAFLTNETFELTTDLDKIASLSLALKAIDGSVDKAVQAHTLLTTSHVANDINNEEEWSNNRMWTYQTCAEFGFFQTCEKGTACPFTKGLNSIDMYVATCKNLFNISEQEVKDNVQSTNLFYGGTKIMGTRILLPSGSVDPWMANSVLAPPDIQESILWVEGASHHAWTHPSEPSDSEEIKEARAVIWSTVIEWLKEADYVET
eukprot:CFRG6913T1